MQHMMPCSRYSTRRSNGPNRKMQVSEIKLLYMQPLPSMCFLGSRHGLDHDIKHACIPVYLRLVWCLAYDGKDGLDDIILPQADACCQCSVVVCHTAEPKMGVCHSQTYPTFCKNQGITTFVSLSDFES